MQAEIWRPVVGFEGLYQVSDQGRIRALNGQVLKPRLENGYLRLNLSRSSKKSRVYVHIVVAAAFVGPRPMGLQVAHENGNAEDCRATNLRYDTPSGNNLDKRRHGTSLRHERHHRARLTAEQVREIQVAQGTQKEIGARYGVTQSHISLIKRGVLWKGVS